MGGAVGLFVLVVLAYYILSKKNAKIRIQENTKTTRRNKRKQILNRNPIPKTIFNIYKNTIIQTICIKNKKKIRNYKRR